jgi:hypothetical protein
VLAAGDSHSVSSAAPGDWTSILLRGYLIAWLFWLGVTLGAQAFVWLHELTGGAWGRAIRPECAKRPRVSCHCWFSRFFRSR